MISKRSSKKIIYTNLNLTSYNKKHIKSEEKLGVFILYLIWILI